MTKKTRLEVADCRTISRLYGHLENTQASNNRVASALRDRHRIQLSRLVNKYSKNKKTNATDGFTFRRLRRWPNRLLWSVGFRTHPASPQLDVSPGTILGANSRHHHSSLKLFVLPLFSVLQSRFAVAYDFRRLVSSSTTMSTSGSRYDIYSYNLITGFGGSPALTFSMAFYKLS